jgi:hydrogenase nickel incorporation protein HypA/HybF
MVKAMHEAAVMNRIVSIVQRRARANGARKINKLVIQIGELSDVIPDALRMCYGMCTEGTMLAGAALEIETIQARGVCGQCSSEYDLLKSEFKCPECGGEKWTILTGKELLVKEIEVI